MQDDLPGFVNYTGYTLEHGLSSVGKGWESLVREAFEKKPSDVKIVQVKEKFGGLRIYVDIAPKEYHDFLHGLESRSFKICEWCGKPGSLDDSTYWILTLCDEDKELRKQGKNPRWVANE